MTVKLETTSVSSASAALNSTSTTSTPSAPSTETVSPLAAALGVSPDLRLPVLGALLAVYVIWGSTYLAMAIAIETIPPFMMITARFFIAAVILIGVLLARGVPLPTRTQARNAFLIGGLMLGGGTGAVVYAEQWVDSGIAALAVAVVPLWAALFAGIWGRWPARTEWVGIIVGLGGVGLLNLDGGMRANPMGALVLVIGPILWAFGSMYSRQLDMPKGLMSSAVQMFGGAAALGILSLVTSENLTAMPSERSLWAFVYLTTIGSLIGFTAYSYLLRTVRPALATSYAYVNPVVAVVLGALLASERISQTGLVAMFIILAGVVLIVLKPGSRKAAA